MTTGPTHIVEPCNRCGRNSSTATGGLCRACAGQLAEHAVLDAELIVDYAAYRAEALESVCDACLPSLRRIGVHDHYWDALEAEIARRGLR